MKRVRAQYAKYSLCSCGFPALGTHVPMGTVYIVHPDMTRPLTMMCGGCGSKISGTWIFAESTTSGKVRVLAGGRDPRVNDSKYAAVFVGSGFASFGIAMGFSHNPVVRACLLFIWWPVLQDHRYIDRSG
jgi:hypothetical protein